VETAADALSNLYYSAARKICDDATAAAARPGGPPADDDAHVPDRDAHRVLAECFRPDKFSAARGGCVIS
jgi:hypothetical protein